MPRKNINIDYSARDYASIREALIQHAKRYHADTFKDFNESGFGALMLDLTSYVGDILSFYLDYQANESFMDTALEFKNAVKHAKQLGYKFSKVPSSHGIGTFFLLIPANSTGLGPDTRYIPTLKKGSTFASEDGNQFILNEDVNFDGDDNEVVVGRVDAETGFPTAYAIRGYGRVISGALQEKIITVGAFTRFLRLEVGVDNIAEVVKVEDEEGNEYFEVENLSQDVIYRPISNRTSSKNVAEAFLRPYAVPRRFTVERDGSKTFLQFGQGQEVSDASQEKIVDPTNVSLRMFGKTYVSDESFDPNNLIQSDKFGIVPVNTDIRVILRTNSSDNVNAGVDTLTQVTNAIFEFADATSLDSALTRDVRTSLEVTNEDAIVGDVSSFTTNEIKIRAFNSFSAQNRAVTREDYKTMIYKMPPEYGSIKRVEVVRDQDSFKRNLNIYIISEDSNGHLITTNSVIKENLKVWINKNKMLNDTIDILDAKVLNLGIDFSVVGDLESNKHDVLANAIFAVKGEIRRIREIGEPFFITDIYKILQKVKGVVDVTKVKITNKRGGLYSDIKFSIDNHISSDGRYIEIPANVVWEVKFPDQDIRGSIS
jgi:hypothetical protein